MKLEKKPFRREPHPQYASSVGYEREPSYWEEPRERGFFHTVPFVLIDHIRKCRKQGTSSRLTGELFPRLFTQYHYHVKGTRNHLCSRESRKSSACWGEDGLYVLFTLHVEVIGLEDFHLGNWGHPHAYTRGEYQYFCHRCLRDF
jgi:hypothetical protein